MNITSVDLYSANFEEPIRFSLHDNDPSARYQIRSIFGLDAEEIIPKFYGSASTTKVKYYQFSMKPRDIVLRASLSPRFRIDESYSDVRDELYRAISPNRSGVLSLYFKSGESILSVIQGSIIKFEVPYFNKLPEVQITIRCNDPMFRAINPVSFTPAELGDTNHILIPDSLSTAPHGFTMKVIFTATSTSFTIQDVNNTPEWSFKLLPSGGFLVGDELYISTEFSDKQVYIIRDLEHIQLGDKLEPGSIWPVIFHGQNEFDFVEIAKFDWESFEFYAAYWGV